MIIAGYDSHPGIHMGISSGKHCEESTVWHIADPIIRFLLLTLVYTGILVVGAISGISTRGARQLSKSCLLGRGDISNGGQEYEVNIVESPNLFGFPEQMFHSFTLLTVF